jgi:hypothetical protein
LDFEERHRGLRWGRFGDGWQRRKQVRGHLWVYCRKLAKVSRAEARLAGDATGGKVGGFP